MPDPTKMVDGEVGAPLGTRFVQWYGVSPPLIEGSWLRCDISGHGLRLYIQDEYPGLGLNHHPGGDI